MRCFRACRFCHRDDLRSNEAPSNYGNFLGDGILSYTYDAADRLTSAGALPLRRASLGVRHERPARRARHQGMGTGTHPTNWTDPSSERVAADCDSPSDISWSPDNSRLVTFSQDGWINIVSKEANLIATGLTFYSNFDVALEVRWHKPEETSWQPSQEIVSAAARDDVPSETLVKLSYDDSNRTLTAGNFIFGNQVVVVESSAALCSTPTP